LSCSTAVCPGAFAIGFSKFFFSYTVVGVGQDITEDRKHSAELQNMQYLQATQEAKVDTERNMTAYFAHGGYNKQIEVLPFASWVLLTRLFICCYARTAQSLERH